MITFSASPSDKLRAHSLMSQPLLSVQGKFACAREVITGSRASVHISCAGAPAGSPLGCAHLSEWGCWGSQSTQ